MPAYDGMLNMRDYEEMKRDVLVTDYSKDQLQKMVIKLLTYNKDLTEKIVKKSKRLHQFQKHVCLLEDYMAAFVHGMKNLQLKAEGIGYVISRLRQYLNKTMDLCANTESLFRVLSKDHKKLMEKCQSSNRNFTKNIKSFRQNFGPRRRGNMEQNEACTSSNIENGHSRSHKRKVVSHFRKCKKIMSRLGCAEGRGKDHCNLSPEVTTEEEPIEYASIKNSSFSGAKTTESLSQSTSRVGHTRQRKSLTRSTSRLRTKLQTNRRNYFSENAVSSTIKNTVSKSTLKGDELRIVLHDVFKSPSSDYDRNKTKQDSFNSCVSKENTPNEAEILDETNQPNVEFQNYLDNSNLCHHECDAKKDSTNLEAFKYKKSREEKVITCLNHGSKICSPSPETAYSEINEEVNTNDDECLNAQHAVDKSDTKKNLDESESLLTKDASNDIASQLNDGSDSSPSCHEEQVSGNRQCTPPLSPCDGESEMHAKETDEYVKETNQNDEESSVNVEDSCQYDDNDKANEMESSDKHGFSDGCQGDAFVDEEAGSELNADDDEEGCSETNADDDDGSVSDESIQKYPRFIAPSIRRKGPRTPPGSPP